MSDETDETAGQRRKIVESLLARKDREKQRELMGLYVSHFTGDPLPALHQVINLLHDEGALMLIPATTILLGLQNLSSEAA